MTFFRGRTIFFLTLDTTIYVFQICLYDVFDSRGAGCHGTVIVRCGLGKRSSGLKGFS